MNTIVLRREMSILDRHVATIASWARTEST